MRRLALLAVLALAGCGGSERNALTWAPPRIDSPSVTWDVPATGGYLERGSDVDCRVQLPRAPVAGRIQVVGCHDVVVVGGQVRVPRLDPSRETPAIALNGFTGTAHLEGLLLQGPGMSDGIHVNSAAPGSVAQIENVYIGDLHLSSESAQHPDAIQTWTGPHAMRIDKLTAAGLQGLNLDPANEPVDGVRHPSAVIDIRRTNVRLDESAQPGRQCFASYRTPRYARAMTRLQDVYCAHASTEAWASTLFPRSDVDPSWWGFLPGHGGVRQGVPPGGDELSPADVGVDYRSPGYA
jgi:hypothetical protein